MLDIKRVIAAKPKQYEQAEMAVLSTPWTNAVDPEHPLPEHPCPRMRRKSWTSLNGMWQCAFTDGTAGAVGSEQALAQQPLGDDAFNGSIVVPFSPEAPLSGVGQQLKAGCLLWYRKLIDAPVLAADEDLVLHFQAVDHACRVWLNGRLLGTHVGGYTPFAFVVTDVLRADGQANELVMCVADFTEESGQLRGKQRLGRFGIWYTAQSGIWQSVWTERVPKTRVESLRLRADAQGILEVDAQVMGQAALSITITDGRGAVVAGGSVPCAEQGRCAFSLVVPNPQLWSPDEPTLYDVTVTYGDDQVSSYCAFRTVEMRKDDAGTPRVFLNGKPLFLKGVLDQGYWPDGLMTAPCDDALVHDIQAMKDLGFNMLRKHIKVESERWYYHCDRLGILVWQDMVTGGGTYIPLYTSYVSTLFKATWDKFRDDKPSHWEKLSAGDSAYREEWERSCLQVIDLLGDHPCIITWVLFNEGWGQFEAKRMTEMARKADPSRPIDAVSGWWDQHCGDFKSVHNYFRPMQVWPDKRHGRAFVISEFGGLSLACEGHTSLVEAYGYDTYESTDELKASVYELLGKVDSLEAKGLAGYVFTQLSDIEDEVNGILTYDRKVNKLAKN